MSEKRSVRRSRKLHVTTVTVDWLLSDLDTAFCRDRAGRRYTIDRRSAVSMSALFEGLQLDVYATESGLVKSLAISNACSP
jgi:hypothetical protein